jgi:hypothetical protein
VLKQKLAPLTPAEQIAGEWSPDGLRRADYLYRLQITDIRANGETSGTSFGAVQSALSQLIFKDELRETLKENPAFGFAIPDELEAI